MAARLGLLATLLLVLAGCSSGTVMGPGDGKLAPAAAAVPDPFCNAESAKNYKWLEHDGAETACARFAIPKGFRRVKVAGGSFEEWLRHLPLKPPASEVFLFDGKKKFNQHAHSAVVDIDTGKRDLQQCADAVMRLRAEYLFAAGKADAIHFNFANGTPAPFSQWASGQRPRVNGNAITWAAGAKKDATHTSLRKYLDIVFAYAGTASLVKELKPVPVREIRAGDVFIKGGSPGHAALVIDVAENPATGEKVFLLAQSFMPAQDVHILKNPSNGELSPWYDASFGRTLKTPEWTFSSNELMRFDNN